MNSEERRQRIVELFRGCDAREMDAAFASLRANLASERQRQVTVAALLQERAGLEAQLAHYGYDPRAA
jgi:hypothetical protein